MRERITIRVEQFDARRKKSFRNGWMFDSTKMDSDPDGIMWSLVKQLRESLAAQQKNNLNPRTTNGT
jgi:hypothetical protein